ncbi:MAG TPA: acylhydrolase, partial [Alistipes sp.]|nr:acylhydrolase [Alistipes sp.]
PPAVVFMGNSITDGWDNAHPEFFTANNFACRGIGGQVTGQ